MSVTHWIRHLSESLVEKLLHGVVVRVLTGTRHKGAMEAARASYGQLCSVLLSSNSNLGHLIYKQVCFKRFHYCYSPDMVDFTHIWIAKQENAGFYKFSFF